MAPFSLSCPLSFLTKVFIPLNHVTYHTELYVNERIIAGQTKSLSLNSASTSGGVCSLTSVAMATVLFLSVSSDFWHFLQSNCLFPTSARHFRLPHGFVYLIGCCLLLSFVWGLMFLVLLFCSFNTLVRLLLLHPLFFNFTTLDSS